MEREPDLDGVAEGAGEQVAQRGQGRGRVDGDRRQFLAAREGEQMPGQAGAALDRGQGLAGQVRQARLAGGSDGDREDLEIGRQSLEQVVEVMGDAAGQAAEHIHALRTTDELLVGDPLRHVAGRQHLAAEGHGAAIDGQHAVVEPHLA